MDAEQALHSFWSSFDLPAYDENSVPENAQLPYITYSVSYDSFGSDVSMTASVWDRTMSWERLTSKVHEISNAITDGGRILHTDNGGIWLRKGNPFYQRMGDVDDSIKRMYINVFAEYIHGGY